MRPYEKCFQYGATMLSDTELLAVVLRTGTTGKTSIELAEQILQSCHQSNSLLGLIGLSVSELLKIKGVGKVKAIQIKCICELSRRLAKETAARKLSFLNPEAIAKYYMQDLRCLTTEHLVLVMLDSKCRLVKDMILSIGTVNASLITPREIFIEALRSNAVSIVILHNHPSGDATPSKNDLSVTKRIMEAGKLIGINLIDHIIIGDNTYTSLKEKEFM
jgi:DNA repair protein RadC